MSGRVAASRMIASRDRRVWITCVPDTVLSRSWTRLSPSTSSFTRQLVFRYPCLITNNPSTQRHVSGFNCQRNLFGSEDVKDAYSPHWSSSLEVDLEKNAGSNLFYRSLASQCHCIVDRGSVDGHRNPNSAPCIHYRNSRRVIYLETRHLPGRR